MLFNRSLNRVATSPPENAGGLCNITPLQCMKMKHAFFGGCFCLFLVIGMPLLFLSCNPDIDNMCLTTDVVHGTAYGHRLGLETCRDCHSENCGDRGCDEVCGDEYPCYQGYVDLHYDGPGDDCVYVYHRKYASEERAMSNSPPIMHE